MPKFWNEKGYYTLNNSHYFGGRDKLSSFQDSYTKWITDRFKNFKRGIRGSKAKHIDLKTFYSLVKENLNVYEAKSIEAHAKENFLNKLKIDALEETVTSLEQKLENNKITIQSCNKIIDNNEKLKKSNALYKHTIRMLSIKYNIPDKQVKDILDKSKESNNRSIQRERQ